MYPRHGKPGSSLAALRSRPLCLVYQILWSVESAPTPGGIYDFLSNPRYTFVGINIKSDLEKLQRGHFLRLGYTTKCVDLAKLAVFVYRNDCFEDTELKDLASYVLKKTVDMPRKIIMSDWGAERLTEDQIMYASVEAFMSYEIGRVLKASDYKDTVGCF